MHYCFIQRSYFLSSFYFTFQLHFFLTFYFLATFPKTSSVSKSSHSFTLKCGLDSRFTHSCFAIFKSSHSFTLRCRLDSRFARSCFASSLFFCFFSRPFRLFSHISGSHALFTGTTNITF